MRGVRKDGKKRRPPNCRREAQAVAHCRSLRELEKLEAERKLEAIARLYLNLNEAGLVKPRTWDLNMIGWGYGLTAAEVKIVLQRARHAFQRALAREAKARTKQTETFTIVTSVA